MKNIPSMNYIERLEEIFDNWSTKTYLFFNSINCFTYVQVYYLFIYLFGNKNLAIRSLH